VRALLFDLDDTLYPRETFVQSGFVAVSRYVDVSWRRSAAAALTTLQRAHESHAGREFQVLCLEHRLPLSAIPALVDVFRTHAPSIALHAPVRAMLQQLRREGWRLGVVTNGNPDVQRGKVHALGLGSLVDCVIYADEEAPGGKPDPRVFRKALATLDAAACEAVLAGDDLKCDAQGGRSAGLRTIRVTAHLPAGVTHVVAGDISPDATVNSVLDVPPAASLLLEGVSRVH
jgi:putative hydrolase of the HAD superfamily